MIRLRGASATHVGQVRETNQDRAMMSTHLGAVADGMGGHLGGEHAAALAVAELKGVRGPISEDRLIGVIKAANQRIHEGSSSPEYRGMGTTVVAATLDPETSIVTIVNVGDSRGYLLRDEELKQITVDHSLVEDLLRQGRLTEEEARVHPQRNIVTRALGIGPEVEVDAFSINVQHGDRLLLASDGLFNEVEDEGITDILNRTTDPAKAVDELVNTALVRGGRDNVTVVVLDLVDTELAPSDAEVSDEDSATEESASADDATSDTESEGHGGPDGDSDGANRPFWRRLRLRSVMLLVSVFGILGLGLAGTAVYARSGYYADGVEGEVVIFRGRPGGVLWFKPSVEQATDIEVDALDGASLDRLQRKTVWPTLQDAREFVENFVFVTDPPTG